MKFLNSKIYGLIAIMTLVPVCGWAQSDVAARSGPELLPYGSRAGMDVTIRKKEGLGTKSAIIYGQLTKQNAKNYCTENGRDNVALCVETYLKETRLADSIVGNCQTGDFSTFYGDQLRFMGKGRLPDGSRGDVVINRNNKQTLDGSSASGLSYALEQFRALCPTNSEIRAATAISKPSATDINFIAVVARGISVVPGAIICKDYATVQTLFSHYTTHWTETMQDRATQGQSELLRGRALSEPDPTAYGCVLVPQGRPMLLRPNGIVPVVTVTTDSGTEYTGVTMQPMVVRQR